MTADTLRRVVPALSVVVALAAVGGGAWWSQQRVPVESAVITRVAPELGPHAHALLPDIDDAVVVVPDRPHDPAEVRAADRFARITRRRTFRVSTNAAAMRGPMPPSEGPRILALGDSVTFGWGVPDDQTWPALLSERLGLPVLNAGVPAMKPGSMAAWAELHLRDLEPDLVLFTRRPDHSMPDAFGDFVRAVRRVEQLAAPAPVGVLLPPVSTFDVRGARQWEAEAQRIEAAVAPVPVLDLTRPFRDALPRSGVVLEQPPGAQRVVRLPEGVEVLRVAHQGDQLAPEVVALFEGDDQIAEPLFFDGGHPDADGFGLFATAVAGWVEAQGWPSRW